MCLAFQVSPETSLSYPVPLQWSKKELEAANNIDCFIINYFLRVAKLWKEKENFYEKKEKKRIYGQNDKEKWRHID